MICPYTSFVLLLFATNPSHISFVTSKAYWRPMYAYNPPPDFLLQTPETIFPTSSWAAENCRPAKMTNKWFWDVKWFRNIKDICRNTVSALERNMNKTPYETWRALIFLELCSEKWPQKYQKSIRFPLRIHAILRLCEISQNVSYTTFWSFRQRNTLWNLSFIYTSGPLLGEMTSKVWNTLGFPQKIMQFYDFAKHRESLATQRFGASGKGIGCEWK